jgi:hypothetical protein
MGFIQPCAPFSLHEKGRANASCRPAAAGLAEEFGGEVGAGLEQDINELEQIGVAGDDGFAEEIVGLELPPEAE